jgi:hypothetical protein
LFFSAALLFLFLVLQFASDVLFLIFFFRTLLPPAGYAVVGALLRCPPAS